MTLFQEHVDLASLTTLRVGGEARFFTHITTKQELSQALTEACNQNLPIFILGGGSNIVVRDTGWNGVVLKIDIPGIEYTKNENDTLVSVGAGVSWDDLVRETVENGLHGLENLSLIPGTVGASPIQNIGAYGAEVKDTIVAVHALHKETQEERIFSNEECQFGYRESFFKTPEGKRWVIFKVDFLLTYHGELNTEYKDVASYLEENSISNPTLQDIREAIVTIRTRKLPDLQHYGTAGSFFKNPIISSQQATELKEKYPDIPLYEKDDQIKVSLAWILDHVLNLKGFSLNHVSLYHNQPLVLVTEKGAQAKDILALKEYVATEVKKSTGIEIEMEPQVV